MLALICGTGELPALVAAACRQKPLVCVLEGFSPENLDADEYFRLEHLGSVLERLRQKGITEVCFCGAIERPPLDPSAIDTKTLPLVPMFMQAMASGDDAALRTAMEIFERHGFKICAAHEIAPDLLAPEGVLSREQPDDGLKADVDKADAVLAALSSLDVGQGCVVGGGQVLGIETIGGTDHMLQSLPMMARKVPGVLVKQPKLTQDRRADLPTIGPETVRAAVAAGLAGIVIEAGAVILLQRDEMRRLADEHGMVLWSRVRR